MGVLNVTVRNNKIAKCIGKYGGNISNRNDEVLILFVVYIHLDIMNTWFKHKDTNLHGMQGARNQLGYIIVNQKLFESVLECRVFRGFEFVLDHFMLVAQARIQPRWCKSKSQKEE
jgi:hypothetical protein